MKLNKKGSAVVELIISIAIFAAIVFITTSFRIYLATHVADMTKKTTFYTHIDNELAYMYSMDNWDNLEETKNVDTGKGVIEVKITPQGVSEFDTEVIQVNFELEELGKELQLERSVSK